MPKIAGVTRVLLFGRTPREEWRTDELHFVDVEHIAMVLARITNDPEQECWSIYCQIQRLRRSSVLERLKDTWNGRKL